MGPGDTASMSALSKLGCAYPACESTGPIDFEDLTRQVRACPRCGRLMAACASRRCVDEAMGAYNQAFARFCRRCGRPLIGKLAQAPLWEEAGRAGWTEVPQPLAEGEGPEVVHELPRSSDYFLSMAMVRGTIAVHQSGHFLSLVKGVPVGDGPPRIWSLEDPFPELPERESRLIEGLDVRQRPPRVYPPRLLPDERRLLYAGRQGMLVLDLWSCGGLSAHEDAPRYRLVSCRRRSIVAPPVVLDETRIGVLTQSWERPADRPFAWTVWDLSRPPAEDAEVSDHLDDDEAGRLEIPAPPCRCEEVAGRVLTFATARGHWIWDVREAAEGKVEALRQTWPGPGTPAGATIDLDGRADYLSPTPPPGQSFLVQGHHAERFSWFLPVRGAEGEAEVHQYEVQFDTRLATSAQKVRNLPAGAVPIGPASDADNPTILKTHFRSGRRVYSLRDGNTVSLHQMDVPDDVHDLRLHGPLVLIVTPSGKDERSVLIKSLHHPGAGVRVELQARPASSGASAVRNKLIGAPLLWGRWLYTVELDADGRLWLLRRRLRFGPRRTDPRRPPEGPPGP